MCSKGLIPANNPPHKNPSVSPGLIAKKPNDIDFGGDRGSTYFSLQTPMP
jgi:hypothetical protein